jgi:hypothetical protein
MQRVFTMSERTISGADMPLWVVGRARVWEARVVPEDPKAVKIIRRLRDSYQRAGDEAGFTAYLADLRQRHRRKTSFIAKLDKALARR